MRDCALVMLLRRPLLKVLLAEPYPLIKKFQGVQVLLYEAPGYCASPNNFAEYTA